MMKSAAEGADVDGSAAQGAPAAAVASNPWANPSRLHAALVDDSRAQAARTVLPAGATPSARVAHAEVKDAPPPLPVATWDVAQLAAVPFERRGFVNSGNLCFANATLQALLGLDPFVALLRHLAQTQLPQEQPTSTLRALAALSREFPPEEDRAHVRAVSRPRSGKSAVCIDDFFSSFLATFDASLGAAMASSARGARQAARRVRQQQDAHEFLSALLDAAHVELVQLAHAGRGEEVQPAAAAEDSSGWECVGRRRNTSFVARTHQDASTPVTDIFGGVQASVVKRSGAKPSVTQEPFKMLSLDVSTDSVLTLEDALSSYCAPEALEGFQDARGEETSASRSLHISEAPLVLLLNLKLFRFTQRGEEKISKRVQFGEFLTLSRSVCGGREGARYRLAALVEHIGASPRSGHYVAFAQSAEGVSWLRFDDTTVQPCSLESVLARPAYILAYQRM